MILKLKFIFNMNGLFPGLPIHALGAAALVLTAMLPVLLGAMAPVALAQSSTSSGASQTAAPEVDDPVLTMFPHSQTARWWVSGQSNIIMQWHPSFDAKYSGQNSFKSYAEHATSNVSSLYTGLQLTRTTEIFMHFEMADGGGISDALGLAGFTDLDVVRNPTLGPTPYIARGMIRQIIPLSDETVEAERGPWYLATKVPVRRIELRFGKLGMNDFFDTNDAGTDSHLQFMNWTVDDNGAYDYAADTRGYTMGLIAEYHDRNWVFRFSEGLMPKIANGIDLQWNLRKAREENYELELHPSVGGKRNTTLRLLTFVNHANMGVYRDAVADYLAGKTTSSHNHRPSGAHHGEVRIRRKRVAAGHPELSRFLALRVERRAARILRLYGSRPDLAGRRRPWWRALET
jgi:high affinity Mn2+ porin